MSSLSTPIRPKDLPSHIPLPIITNYTSSAIANAPIENCIGYIPIPLAVAGPLLIAHPPSTTHLNTPPTSEPLYEPPTFNYAAMATIEGALVASACRGAKALSLSGPVKYKVFSSAIQRDPAIFFANVDDAVRLHDTFSQYRDTFIQKAQNTSRHTWVLAITLHIIGPSLHIITKFDTDGAAGQNMVTMATEAALSWLVEQIQDSYAVTNYVVDSCISGDKSVSRMSREDHRGTQVMAWGRVTDQQCREVLKVSAREFNEWYGKVGDATTRMGMHGQGANPTNMMTAIFAATGQDIASVAESCWAQLTVDYEESSGDLLCTMYYSGLTLGVVGGGTNLEVHQEALKIMGCDGVDRKGRLAGMIAGFAMALDLSTLSALVTNTFAHAHRTLGRARANGAKMPVKDNKL